MNESGNSGMGMSQGVCQECGFAHPPTPGGCPLRKEKSPSGETIDFNSALDPLRQILYAQIKMKNIKDSNKFFKWFIVECTKLAEGYSE